MVSVIIPFYNEIGSAVELLSRTDAVFKKLCISEYEILIVNNGSSEDQSSDLARLCETNPRHRILRLSRNFGYQGALWAGLDHALGDPVIFMDADGEDPPEVIADFIERWLSGYDVVYGIRKSRRVGWFANRCYLLFYRLLGSWSAIHIPLDAGEFSLVGGQALVALKAFQDRTRMMRILRAWVGYRQAGVEYHRESRIGGKSKFSFLSAVAFAWDGFVAATDIPVRFAIYCALSCVALAMIGSLYYLFWYFFGSQKIPGFASLNITILFLFSFLFACFAVLARYVITILDEARKRPPYLIDSVETVPERRSLY